ncbi:MAG: class I SAM-dependent methyltransferase [Balneolaceae bacterium]
MTVRPLKKGPNRSTQLMLEPILKCRVDGKSLIDLGGGIGVISFELFHAGLTSSVHVDASSGYLEVCKRGDSDRFPENERLYGKLSFMKTV